MKPISKNIPDTTANEPAEDAPDRHPRDTNSMPPIEAHPDTVKLTHHTWQPPPSSMDTVKLPQQPPSSDDTETDIQEARTEQTNIAPPSSPIVGTSDTEVAGEIGSSDELPARIVSAPPSIRSSPIKLPGMPAPVGTNSRMDDGAGPRDGSQNKTAAIATAAREPGPALQVTDVAAMPQSQHFQMGRTAAPLPPQRHVDPTMVLRINNGLGARARRAIAITAVASSLIGLAVGYILWGLPDRPPEQDTDSSATSSSQKPAVNIPLCQVAVTSEPDNARVRANGKLFGHTPIDIELPCNTTSLTLSKRAFVRQSMPLTLSTDSAQTTHGILKRKQFKISIKSNPEGARVVRGDQELGKTPFKVTLPGYIETTLVLRRKGYLHRNIKLAPTNSTSVHPRLTPARPPISYLSSPGYRFLHSPSETGCGSS